MSLVPMRPILDATDTYSYAQGAFNVNAVAQAKAVIDIHSLFRSPAILQGADLANGFMGGRKDFQNATIEDKIKGAANIAKAVKQFALDAPIPVALHLDHGKNMESVKAAIEGGYTSVMIDGSSLPLEQNIELTREVVTYAHPLGVTVEGELGVLAGVEDHVFSETSTYTNPLDAIRFLKATKVDALAISYGTQHGANKGKDVHVRREIAIAVKECMRHEHIHAILVSHGSSTVPQNVVADINALGGDIKDTGGINIDELMEVSHLGIGKINVDTDIRLFVTRAIREYFLEKASRRTNPEIKAVWDLMEAKPSAFDPRYYMTPLMETMMFGSIPNEGVAEIVERMRRGVMEAVGILIVKFGSVDKAEKVEVKTLEQMAEFYRKEGI